MCPICLCRDACVLRAAERVGNTLCGARVYLAAVFRTLMPPRQSRPDSLSQLVRDGWPAESFAFTLGPLKASTDALLKAMFQMLWRGRIEALLIQKQVDSERVKLGQERH